jgi:hypothetical protein
MGYFALFLSYNIPSNKNYNRKEKFMIRVCIETSDGERLDVCTCENEENVVRKIIQGYEDIWWNTLQSGGTSNDPIIQNWEGSTTLVESVEDPEKFYMFVL